MNDMSVNVPASVESSFISDQARTFILENINTFRNAAPFNHLVVEDFFKTDVAEKLAGEFLDYESDKWFFYKNSIENKKALNNWNEFPSATYQAFSELNSQSTVDLVSALTGKTLFEDRGLHGGGWHMHGPGGNLNPHLDYSIHPKLGLQRKVNIIIYMSPEMKPEYGGHLGLWSHGDNAPGELVYEVEPKFNRAIIFDTTQNSWHGMSRGLTQPSGVYRKSFAAYYLCIPAEDADPRGRALFAAREDQRNDPKVDALIKARADVNLSNTVYRD